LLRRKIIERVANENDRREFALQLTPKGRALYEELIPRLLRKERQILSCLSARDRKVFAAALGKIESYLGLVQTIEQAGKTGAY
jgi:DNA-binding MarR family transcriptional regulator